MAVDHHELRVGRGLHPVPAFLPANPPVHGRDPLAGKGNVAGCTRAEEEGMIARQLDELYASLIVVNFQGGHARVFGSGSEVWSLVSRDQASLVGGSDGSAERFLGDDLEAEAIVSGHHAEPGDPDLAGLPAAVADLELGELFLDALGVELKDDSLADLDPGLSEQGEVRGLATSSLPQEVEPAVAPPRSVSLGGLGAGEIREVNELVGARDDGKLHTQGIKLASIFLGGLLGIVNDAPSLLAGHAAVAGSKAQARSSGAQLGGPLAAGDRPAAGHHRAKVHLGQPRAGLRHRVEHRTGGRLHRRFLEVPRLFLIVGGKGAGSAPGTSIFSVEPGVPSGLPPPPPETSTIWSGAVTREA